MRNSETRQQKYARESAEKQRQNIDKNDAERITATLSALLTFNTDKARELIKHPQSLGNLIQPRQTGLVCFYALHATVLALIDENPNDILNAMSDEDISTLKKLLNIAINHKRADKTLLDNILAQRLTSAETGKITTSSGITRKMTASEHWQNKFMLKSIEIYIKVYDFWDDAVSALQQWTTSIDNFERNDATIIAPTPIETPTAPEQSVSTDNVLTYQQIATQLGVKSYEIYNHIIGQIFGVHTSLTRQVSSARIDEMRGWFIKELKQNGGLKRYLLREEYIGAYKQAFETRPTRAKKHTKPSVRSNSIAKEPIKINNQSDIKSLEATLAGIVKICKKSKTKLNAAINNRSALQQAIADTTDDSKIDELSEKLAATNQTVKENRATVEQLNPANDLYEKLQLAKVSLDNIATEISKFIESVKQK